MVAKPKITREHLWAHPSIGAGRGYGLTPVSAYKNAKKLKSDKDKLVRAKAEGLEEFQRGAASERELADREVIALRDEVSHWKLYCGELKSQLNDLKKQFDGYKNGKLNALETADGIEGWLMMAMIVTKAKTPNDAISIMSCITDIPNGSGAAAKRIDGYLKKWEKVVKNPYFGLTLLPESAIVVGE